MAKDMAGKGGLRDIEQHPCNHHHEIRPCLHGKRPYASDLWTVEIPLGALPWLQMSMCPRPSGTRYSLATPGYADAPRWQPQHTKKHPMGTRSLLPIEAYSARRSRPRASKLMHPRDNHSLWHTEERRDARSLWPEQQKTRYTCIQNSIDGERGNRVRADSVWTPNLRQSFAQVQRQQTQTSPLTLVVLEAPTYRGERKQKNTAPNYRKRGVAQRCYY